MEIYCQEGTESLENQGGMSRPRKMERSDRERWNGLCNTRYPELGDGDERREGEKHVRIENCAGQMYDDRLVETPVAIGRIIGGKSSVWNTTIITSCFIAPLVI